MEKNNASSGPHTSIDEKKNNHSSHEEGERRAFEQKRLPNIKMGAAHHSEKLHNSLMSNGVQVTPIMRRSTGIGSGTAKGCCLEEKIQGKPLNDPGARPD